MWMLSPATSLGCTSSRFGSVRVAGLMTGPSVLSFILVRMQGEETQRSSLTAVFLAPNFTRGLARRMILVNMLMASSSPGCILLSTGPGFARTRLVVLGKFASLLIRFKNYEHHLYKQMGYQHLLKEVLNILNYNLEIVYKITIQPYFSNYR